MSAQAVSKAPSRLRYGDGTSKVASFATYYRVPDNTTLTALGQKDFNIVQPDITADQLSAIQNISYGAVYLAIGELGNNNTYYENGVARTGQTIYDAHKNDSPKWFLGVNGNFGAYILNLTNPAVRAFVAQQADALLDRGFDGLFLDTADDAEFFSNADIAGSTSQVYVEGAVSLDAGRPDYPTMRRAYIDTIKALRGVAGNALLVQNGGFDLLLDRQNAGDGTQGYIDALMHEVAITKSNKPLPVGGVAADDAVWPFQPQNYETWEKFYERNQAANPKQTDADRAFRANRDAVALEYFKYGDGVVFQQDFGHPENYAVQCASYNFARDLRATQHKDGWIAAYSDAAFNRVYDYADSTPQIRAIPGCETYDKVTAPDFTTTFSPPSLNTGVGRSATATLNLAAVSGYSGKVNLSLGNLPAGITATLSQTRVTPGPQTQVTLTLNVAASAAASTYIIPVRAQSQGESMRYDLRLKTWKTTGDSVFVAQAGLGKVLAFDSSASLTSNTAPARSLPTASVQQAWNVALDSAGNQYVVDNVAAGKVTRFPSFSLNSGAGVSQIRNLSYPTGLAVDAQSHLWVVQSGSTPGGAAVTTPHVGRYDNGSTTESLGFNVDRALGLGFPQMLALDGNTLWLNTNFGLILKYNVTGTPVLSGVYTFPGTLDDLGGGTLTVQNGTLWISGKNAGVSSVMAVNIAALPAANGPYSVNGDAAVTRTITAGLYDPAGLAFDSAGNLWVVNKTGAAGVAGTNPNDPGSLIRFSAASLATSTPAPSLNIGLGSRYPVGLAVGKP
ncbi:hypothetical protein BOO71_0012475 [Deinococcus marmoris]|uniref:Glycoside-hydrolase family GH114 TIM-barrel domain-containing protein n=1 Tax=Deinococcus marmoris TaxID=249408 RepID=A0A1U7NTF8_9DEIO|nr:hypothetical protein BOO71_0012475 [Deinococcus marmoris]